VETKMATQVSLRTQVFVDEEWVDDRRERRGGDRDDEHQPCEFDQCGVFL